MKKTEEVLWDRKETAEYLGISPRTLDQWVWRGKLPFIRLSGRLVRFCKTDIETWLTKHKGIGTCFPRKASND